MKYELAAGNVPIVGHPTMRETIRRELQQMAEDGELERLMEVARCCATLRARGLPVPGVDTEKN